MQGSDDWNNIDNGNYRETQLGYKQYSRESSDSGVEVQISMKEMTTRLDVIDDEEQVSKNISGTGFHHQEAEVISLTDMERTKWAGKVDYMLSLIGFAVDLANVWRFPYLCYKNGGGVFLIPYCIFLFMAGIPLFMVELGIGQFNQRGVARVWKMCPMFKGIGYAMIILTTYVMFYYTAIIAWAVYFVGRSMNSVLPWSCCGNPWNTPQCRESIGNGTWKNPICSRGNDSELIANYTLPSDNETSSDDLFKFTPASEFYYREVLGVHSADGLEYLGIPRWQLTVCLLVVLCILCLAISRGVRSSGKVVYVTATLPYITLFILLIRGVTLPGSYDGIKFYLNPDFSRLSDLEVWTDAATQIFYSLGVGFGVHLTFASYNDFNNNIKIDAIVTSLINCTTSFFSGFVIFSILGFMAKKNGVSIDNVASDGPGLVFVVYPEIMSQLPAAPFWAFVFFVMLFTLGLDSAMGAMEMIVTGLTDDFTFLKKRRLWFCGGLSIFIFLLALMCMTNGGIYMVTLLDMHAAGTALLFCVLVEAIVVSWVYGVDRFSEDVEKMIGSKPALPWRICWKIISPGFLFFIVIVAMAFYQPMTLGTYTYPWWANLVGWLIAVNSMAMIPLYAIYKLLTLPGSFKQRIALAISREEDHEEIIKGSKSLKHWLTI